MTAQQRTRKRITESNGNSSAIPWRRVVNAIARKRDAVGPDRAVLVGISGIDASGKGYLAAKIADRLEMEGLKVAPISADDWLNLPDVCINPENPGEHFYKHALRFDEMFERLIIPLRNDREIDVVADRGDAKATVHRKHGYVFRNIDIVLLEGIFLFKPAIANISILKSGSNVRLKLRWNEQSPAARKACHRQKRSRRSRQSIFQRSEFTWRGIIRARLRIALLRMMKRSRS